MWDGAEVSLRKPTNSQERDGKKKRRLAPFEMTGLDWGLGRADYFVAARMWFPLRVTAPLKAKTRPVTLAPVVTVLLIFARMLP